MTQNTNNGIPLEIWDRPVNHTQTLDATVDGNKLLAELGQPANPALGARISAGVNGAISGGAGTVGLILSIAVAAGASFPPAAPIIAGVIGVAAGLAAGITAIVNRVRAENWTQVTVINAIPNSRVTSIRLSDDFQGQLVDAQGKQLDVGVLASAQAACTEEAFGGFVLRMLPSGGGSKCAGSVHMTVQAGAAAPQALTLSFENRVAAGIESTYSFFGDGNLVSIGKITSNRREDRPSAVRAINPFLEYELSLDHDDGDGGEDSRKDNVGVVLRPTPLYLNALKAA